MAVHPAQLGRFFEDFTVGDVYQHPLGRTINYTDAAWFALLTGNTNQNHFNVHLAETNPVTDGRIVVNSGFTVALVLGLSVIDMSQNAVSDISWTDVKFAHPVAVGDTVYAESLCLDKRESTESPDAGIVTMRTRGLNQDGDEVVSWKRSVMIPKRGSGIGQAAFPDAKTGPMHMPEEG